MALLAGVNGASSTRCMAANMPPQPAVVTARRAVFVGRMAVVQDTITGRRTVSLSHMKLRAALVSIWSAGVTTQFLSVKVFSLHRFSTLARGDSLCPLMPCSMTVIHVALHHTFQPVGSWHMAH